jgi:hypothetical protein
METIFFELFMENPQGQAKENEPEGSPQGLYYTPHQGLPPKAPFIKKQPNLKMWSWRDIKCLTESVLNNPTKFSGVPHDRYISMLVKELWRAVSVSCKTYKQRLKVIFKALINPV